MVSHQWRRFAFFSKEVVKDDNGDKWSGLQVSLLEKFQNLVVTSRTFQKLLETSRKQDLTNQLVVIFTTFLPGFLYSAYYHATNISISYNVYIGWQTLYNIKVSDHCTPQDIDITCTASGRGKLLIGDSKGHLHSLTQDMKVCFTKTTDR